MSSPIGSKDLTEQPLRVDWAACALTVTVVLALALAFCPNNVDSDLWGHVLYGQEWIASGHLPDTATYTFTAPQHRWINHENLAELALAWGIQSLGVTWMQLIKSLLGVFIVGLMLHESIRRGTRPVIAIACLFLVALSLTAFWALRPQLFSFLFLAALIALCNRAFRSWSEETRVELPWLLPIPLLFVAWANSHGAFVAGLALLLAYLGGRSLEAIYRLGYAAEKHVFSFACISVAAVGGTLLNPYRQQLWSWLWATLRLPRPENSEWVSPTPAHDFFWPFVLLSATCLFAWCFTQRKRDWVQFALLALCLWQACSHLRHIALLAILAGFWIPPHLQSAIQRILPAPATSTANSRWQTWVMAAVFTAASALLTVRLHARLATIEVPRNDYPVTALQFMHNHQLGGKMVVSFSWAQYVIAAMSPHVDVAFDGRFRTCYPQNIIDMHFDFQIGENGGNRFRSARSGAIDGHRVLQHGRPDLVLVDRRFTREEEVMDSQQDFSLLYQDQLAQLWGRRSKFDAPESPSYLAPASRRISNAEQRGIVAWPAFPEQSRLRLIASETR